MAEYKSRQVKLQPKHRELAGGGKNVPWLNVSGVWLEELGFKVGDVVRISAREKLLIIELAEPAEVEARHYKEALQTMQRNLKALVP